MIYLIKLVVLFLTLLKCTHQADLNIGRLFIEFKDDYYYYYFYFTAIIGGGIGGTSCAYFIKEIFKDLVNLDVYEGNKIGGRLSTVIMSDGNEYETGGSVIHERNKYMSNFLTNFGKLLVIYILKVQTVFNFIEIRTSKT